jgi:hypothetical protein
LIHLGPYARIEDSLATEERGDRLPPDDPGLPGRLAREYPWWRA